MECVAEYVAANGSKRRVRQRPLVLPGGSWSEPESDCCGGDGAVEDVGLLVVTGGVGPEVLELVDGSLDLVAAFVDLAVEAGGPAAFTASPSAVGPLVLRLRDRVLDLTSSRVAAVSAGTVCRVAAEVSGRVCGCPPWGRGTQMRLRISIICGASPNCGQRTEPLDHPTHGRGGDPEQRPELSHGQVRAVGDGHHQAPLGRPKTPRPTAQSPVTPTVSGCPQQPAELIHPQPGERLHPHPLSPQHPSHTTEMPSSRPSPTPLELVTRSCDLRFCIAGTWLPARSRYLDHGQLRGHRDA